MTSEANKVPHMLSQCNIEFNMGQIECNQVELYTSLRAVPIKLKNTLVEQLSTAVCPQVPSYQKRVILARLQWDEEQAND